MSWDPGGGELKSRAARGRLRAAHAHPHRSAVRGSGRYTVQTATRDKRQCDQCSSRTRGRDERPLGPVIRGASRGSAVPELTRSSADRPSGN
ncbi:hypothetical protein SKAU_G00072050 [Synaphobranchus kaupii]|uniref:Uncharacterized protein n=1 Tax=Synaphobranchus kaupii TaxID=118154 RepID=A0A9Q1G8J4_SYNKA|nr:hypothetical protein SKAU_G00072050 [Synaphobranchus kaupii]